MNYYFMSSLYFAFGKNIFVCVCVRERARVTVNETGTKTRSCKLSMHFINHWTRGIWLTITIWTFNWMMVIKYFFCVLSFCHSPSFYHFRLLLYRKKETNQKILIIFIVRKENGKQSLRLVLATVSVYLVLTWRWPLLSFLNAFPVHTVMIHNS